MALATVCVAATACAQVDVPESLSGPEPTMIDAGATAPDADTSGCDPATVTHSLRPDAAAVAAVESRTFAPGSYMAEIQARERLRVGVDTATLQFSSVNPFTLEFEGFDVEIAREVAIALFGDPNAITYIGIPSSDRVQALVEGQVDLVASAFTPTCSRREEIAFSTDYYTSTQDVLLRDDDEAETVADLAGRRICASAGTTTLANIAELPEPAPVPVPAAERADCLVMLQQGEVDGMSTNDTILAGFNAQDPNLRILDANLSSEPTALGLPQGHDEWVRYVNAVLDDVRTSGRWVQHYEDWLADLLPGVEGPPAPTYVD